MRTRVHDAVTIERTNFRLRGGRVNLDSEEIAIKMSLLSDPDLEEMVCRIDQTNRKEN
jgi:hypothetical protein